MKQKRFRFSRRWRLAVEGGLLVLLLLLGWCLQGCPRFSAGAAFRRTLSENLRPQVPLVLRIPVGDTGSEWAIGLSGDTATEVLLTRTRLSWRSDGLLIPCEGSQSWNAVGNLLEFRASDGVLCVPLYWKYLLSPAQYPAPNAGTPAVAVLAEPEAVRAELSLAVEAFTPFPDNPGYSYPAAACDLVPLGQEEGWFLFGFDEDILRQGLDLDARGEAGSLLVWTLRRAAAGVNSGENYHAPVQSGVLTLRLFDGEDRLLRTVEIMP